MVRRTSLFLAFVIFSCVMLCGLSGVALASFGFTELENTLINEDGSPAVQAGSHPWAMVTNFNFAQAASGRPDESLKDITLNLPPGLVGNTGAVAKCALKDFLSIPDQTGIPHGSNYEIGDENCPNDTQVGVAEVRTQPASVESSFNFGLYNLEPPPGVPAEFGVNVAGIPIILQASVRTDSDNGISLTVRNASQELSFYGGRFTTWGTPQDPSHDGERGLCLGLLGGSVGKCPLGSGVKPQAFLTLPTSCSSTFPVSQMHANTWEHPTQTVPSESVPNKDAAGNALGILGCGALGFRPSLGISMDTTQADSPAGLTAEVKVPQDGLIVSGGLGTATLEDTKVILP